jgi:N-acetyl sugar amidotransferase
MMGKIKYCKICIQSDTRPGIFLNSEGICSACEGHKEKVSKIDWEAREKELSRLFDQYRNTNGSNYDCIVPVSGGKDSTYQVYVVKKLYKMNPLCVTYRTPLRTDLGQKNLDNLQKSFGVDLLEFCVSPETERKFILKAIKEIGVPGLPQHLGIFSFTLRTAVNMKIPLVVWGENSQLEYGGTKAERQNTFLDRAWLTKHGCLHERQAEDWIDEDLTAQEMQAFRIPLDQELKNANINSFFLGQFLKWDPQENVSIAKANGFTARAEGPVMGIYDFADLDCYLIAFHHYVKWLKYGMTRTFDNVAIEIRNNRMSKEQGLEFIKNNKDDRPLPEHLEKICKFLQITESELFELLERFRNKDIWSKDQSGNWYIPGYLELN